ncbi:MAG: hypothetical protein Fur006_08830 [Coleofasciculaceae cyanobacterium]
MPNFRLRLEVTQKLLVDVGLLALLALFIGIVTITYVCSERNFHWWIDWHARTLEVVTALRDSPAEALQLVKYSLVGERNRLFTLPLIPFILVFGSSRLVYELGLALVYLLPFALAMGAIATQLIRAHSRTVFWATAFLTLFIPVSWIPTFMGIPDTGGAALVGLATFVYLQDIRLKQWWRIPVMGFLIGAAILLRRPFVYAGVTFLGALSLQALMLFVAEVRKQPPQERRLKQTRGLMAWPFGRMRPPEPIVYRVVAVSPYLAELAKRTRSVIVPPLGRLRPRTRFKPKPPSVIDWENASTSSGNAPNVARTQRIQQRLVMAWQNLLVRSVQITLVGATAFATLWIIAPQFTYTALTNDYKTLYTSWSLPYRDIFNLYASFYGWGTWMLVVLGFSACILTRTLPLPAVSFMGISGLLSLLIWLVLLRYGNVFYSLQVTPLVVIGLVALLWTTWLRLKGKVRAGMLGIVGCYLIANLVVGLTPVGTMSRVFHPLFALNMPPLVRTDYDEAVRLVSTLRQLTPQGEPILVVGYQRLQLTSGLVRSAEYLLYQQEKRFLNILPAPEVDSRDSYPLDELLEAEYVVVPSRLPAYSSDPTQMSAVGEWLPDREHDVVKVVFDAFTQNWELTQDFQRLPVQFNFENGVVVSIYQRLRPTSLATAVRTLHAMQQYIGQRPGSQQDWIILSQWSQNTRVEPEPNYMYEVVAFRRDRPWGEKEKTYRISQSRLLARELGLRWHSRSDGAREVALQEPNISTLEESRRRQGSRGEGSRGETWTKLALGPSLGVLEGRCSEPMFRSAPQQEGRACSPAPCSLSPLPLRSVPSPSDLPNVSLVKALRSQGLEQQASTVQVSDRVSPALQSRLASSSATQQTQAVETFGKSIEERSSNSRLPEPNADRTQQLGTSLLYLGSVPNFARVSGAITYIDRACVGSSIRVAMLDSQGQIISSTESVYHHQPKQVTDFELSVRGENPIYLLLNVLNYNRDDLVDSCTLQINPLKISTQKS